MTDKWDHNDTFNLELAISRNHIPVDLAMKAANELRNRGFTVPSGAGPRKGDTFWYLASPYSKYPQGREAAFWMACKAAAQFVQAGIGVYSPIAATHMIAEIGGIDPNSHDIWLPADEPFMLAAKGLVVLGIDGWGESKGVQHEINRFEYLDRPVLFMADTSTLPKGIY